jgi:hypothetical protein
LDNNKFFATKMDYQFRFPFKGVVKAVVKYFLGIQRIFWASANEIVAFLWRLSPHLPTDQGGQPLRRHSAATAEPHRRQRGSGELL